MSATTFQFHPTPELTMALKGVVDLVLAARRPGSACWCDGPSPEHGEGCESVRVWMRRWSGLKECGSCGYFQLGNVSHCVHCHKRITETGR